MEEKKGYFIPSQHITPNVHYIDYPSYVAKARRGNDDMSQSMDILAKSINKLLYYTFEDLVKGDDVTLVRVLCKNESDRLEVSDWFRNIGYVVDRTSFKKDDFEVIVDVENQIVKGYVNSDSSRTLDLRKRMEINELRKYIEYVDGFPMDN